MKFATVAAHAGLCTDPGTGTLSTPIYQTATFRHAALGKSTGYDYSRTANPTRKALEDVVAAMENGNNGFAFSSGMAALTAVSMLFRSGDHLIVSNDLYGGTYRLFEQCFAQLGVEASYVDTSRAADVADCIRPGKTKALLIETPTNPLMRISDLKLLAGIAHGNGCICIVDNTFMTPYLQRPIDFGVDIVVHSGTKYLGGHNDVLCGIVVTANAELGRRIGFIQNATGAVLGPQDSWLMLRGIKTLPIRMEKQQRNAAVLAERLLAHKSVARVYYPGLPDHPGSRVHRSQSSGGGAMISFRVGEKALVERILGTVKVICFAESLGGVETLITYPVTQTHCDIPPEIREKIGVTDDLLRLSVGIEDAEDLIQDLEQAMA